MAGTLGLRPPDPSLPRPAATGWAAAPMPTGGAVGVVGGNMFNSMSPQPASSGQAFSGMTPPPPPSILSRSSGALGSTGTSLPPVRLGKKQTTRQPAGAFSGMAAPSADTPSPASWTGFDPANSVVDAGGFPRVNLGAIYDNARRGLIEETYNTAADAGFGDLRAGPYVSSLHQNIGALQANMANQASNLAESEAGRRLQQTMQTAELGSRATLQEAQLAAQKAMLGMELTSREKLALAQLGEEGRQFDLGLGERSAEFGADLGFRSQQAEDARFQQWLNFLFGGAQNMTGATGRVLPGGTNTSTTPSPFSQIMGPIATIAGSYMGGA